MQNANASRKDLAQALGVTVHAIGMVLTSAGNRERWLSRENHLKAAQFLNVDPTWLMTGSNTELHTPQVMRQNPPNLSPTALELAWLYDQIPFDARIKRVVAYNAATQQILNVLQELNDAPTSPAPNAVAPAKKRTARVP